MGANNEIREGTCKIVYKGETGEEFYVIAIPNMLKVWKNDKTTPLVDVVQSFDVFTSPVADRPSKSQLENTFKTSNNDEVVRFIVENGTSKNV